jgi:aminoglycoside phosphotransferase (APT) family kinase protein
VHGDFASWNLHFEERSLAGVIDFDLTHRDSRAWEFVLARVHEAPGLIDGYQRTATELGIPLPGTSSPRSVRCRASSA